MLHCMIIFTFWCFTQRFCFVLFSLFFIGGVGGRSVNWTCNSLFSKFEYFKCIAIIKNLAVFLYFI